MKKSLGIFAIFIFTCNLVFAQEYLFEKIKTNLTISKSAHEKIERFKSRQAIKQWELTFLRSNIVLSENYKGIFNILNKHIEFAITKNFGKDVNGIQGYKAVLKEGGYAIISSSKDGIGVSIWYKENFYSIEAIDGGFYFVSEIDLSEIAKLENPNDYNSTKKFYKTTQNNSVASALTPATIKVFVAYTPAVLASFSNDVELVNSLISQSFSITTDAFNNSLVSSTIELAGSAQLSYNESGDDETDIALKKGKIKCVTQNYIITL